MSPARDEFLLRPASARDVDAVLAVKRALAMPARPGETATGGFILGAEREAYRQLIAGGCVELLEVCGRVVGYAVALPDPALRASDIWRRRAAIRWVQGFDPQPFEPEPIAYFDQLAVLPGIHVRAYGAVLGLRALAKLFAAGHRHALTTTLRAPVRNAAAHAYLRRIGARLVGQLDETYPGVGAVVSDIYHLDRDTFLARLGRYRGAPPRVAGLAERAVAGTGLA
ncbi:MAG: hypothetical protein H6713_12620 [Myxococcales bacterium]|nr:hypothetical protein [Myxococcales bacterium]